MDVRTLEVFLSTADTLNFSRTAEQLHMSVSAVSRNIQKLEEELGQVLFHRDRRHMELSPAGSALVDYARDAVARWRQLRRDMAGQASLSGEISVFGSVTASYRVLAPILESFRVSYPGVDLMLKTGDQAEGVQRVLDGDTDVSVSARPFGLPERLAFLPLMESPLRIIIPASDCQVRQQVLGIVPGDKTAWRHVPIIVPERGVSRSSLQTWLKQRQLQPRVYAQVAGHEAIVSMVALGLGVGIAPELVIEASGMGNRGDSLPLDAPLPPLSVGLCALQGRLDSPVMAAFWQSARQAYQSTV